MEDLFAGSDLTVEGLPLVAIHIPKTGQLSRKERDEFKAVGQEKGFAFTTTEAAGSRLSRANGKGSRTCQPAEDDLVILAGSAQPLKGALPSERC